MTFQARPETADDLIQLGSTYLEGPVAQDLTIKSGRPSVAQRLRPADRHRGSVPSL
jgi:hypothetical protein